MKRSVKLIKTRNDCYVEYYDDTLDMTAFSDGSGELSVDSIGFHSSEGTHKSRIGELKRIRSIANKALAILEQIENPNIYFPK